MKKNKEEKKNAKVIPAKIELSKKEKGINTEKQKIKADYELGTLGELKSKQIMIVEKKRIYRIVTRRELEEKIRKNNLKVYYYAHIFEHDFDNAYNNSLFWDTKLLLPISGITVYYDYDFLTIDDFTEELDKMLNCIQPNDVLLLDTLNLFGGNISTDYYIKVFTKLKNLDVNLYIVDYSNNSFIEIDINSWLELFSLEEEILSLTPMSSFWNDIEELSDKYYDGADILKDIIAMYSYDGVYY